MIDVIQYIPIATPKWRNIVSISLCINIGSATTKLVVLDGYGHIIIDVWPSVQR